ncbi:glutathione S-transferase theta-1-like [Penaeus chinensis]|uniref:glutathione S-transferase theta-1-like n=1 Tax=Penaeus chinensis TaxID=139456 RepID=UPI001FB73D78|nr:glutathione S-transferase theta-1-like [Penaeus chinensis]
MAASLTLYVDHISQPARALSLLCRAIKAPHHEHHIKLLKGEHMRKEYIAVNPFKKIPAVKDGNTLILESCAALRFIASKYDSTGKWYPQELEVRCKVDEYLDWQHLNTRAHGMGFFRNKILLPALKKSEPDMKVVNEHKKELGRVERDFKNYFLGSKPFIAGDHLTIADLLAACEFEQPIAGGYSMSQPIQDFIERVKSQIGPDYDELHSTMRDFAVKASR